LTRHERAPKSEQHEASSGSACDETCHAIGNVRAFLRATPHPSGAVADHHADGRALRVTSHWSLTGSGDAITERHITRPAVDASDDLPHIANDLSQPLPAFGK
jgi:hypothetical protein